MKMNYYYLNLKKEKKNNFQVIIINNLAFFYAVPKNTEKKNQFSDQKDHSKNIFHCMNPSNA